MLTWTQPALLWASAAVAVPILIHLLMRPRPRRVRFPALALMHHVLTSGQRAHQVRNWLLLLLRSALLLLVAVLLAGPVHSSATDANRADGPVARAIIIDNSASMLYRPSFSEPTTCLSTAHAIAARQVRALHQLPPGSLATVMTTSHPDNPPRLTDSPDVLRAALDAARNQTPTSTSVGPALQAAAALLRDGDLPNQQIHLITDLTRGAWRNVGALVDTPSAALTLRLIDTGTDNRTNLGIVSARGPKGIHPVGHEIPIDVTLRAVGVAASGWLSAHDGARLLTRVGPIDIAPDETRDVTLILPPRPRGPHIITLTLEPIDAFAADQRHFIAIQTGDPPAAWLVTPADFDTDLTALILHNLLAPDTLPAAEQRVALSTLDADEANARLTAAERTQRPALTVVLSGTTLAPAARDALLRDVRQGTTVLLVPQDSHSAPTWPGLDALLCDAIDGIEMVSPSASLRWPSSVERATPEAELSRCAITCRVRVAGVRDAVTTLALYSDGPPALLQRTLGRGRLLLLTTSPAPAWSELGIRAGGTLAWLHELVDTSADAPGTVATLHVDQASRQAFHTLPPNGLVTIERVGDPSDRHWRRLSAGTPAHAWPASRPGHYRIHAADSDDDAYYAVNWPADELDLTRATVGEIRQQTKIANIELETESDPATEHDNAGRPFSIDRALAWLILLIFTAELVTATARRGLRNAEWSTSSV